MSTTLFRRPPRRAGPSAPQGDIALQEPPTLSETQSNGLRMAMTTLPMALMSGVMMMMFFGRSGGPMMLVMAGLMAVATAGMMVGQMAGSGAERKQRTGGDRRDYLRYLSQIRRQIRRAAADQRVAHGWRHPLPGGLWSLAMTTRLWERRPTHPDFGELRVGAGRQRLATRLRPVQTKPIEDLEPLSAKSLRRLVRAYSTVDELPVALQLRGFAQVEVGGDLDRARDLVRAVLGQLVTFHAPDEVLLACCVDEDTIGQWSWAKWLPHNHHPADSDAAGAVRLFGSTVEELERLLGPAVTGRSRFDPAASPSRDEPYVVILTDGPVAALGGRLATSGYQNVTLLSVGPLSGRYGDTRLNLEVADDTVTMVTADRVGREVRSELARADALSAGRCRLLAQLIAPHRVSTQSEPVAEPLTTDFDLGGLLGVPDLAAIDVAGIWATRTLNDRLRVPIGVDGTGNLVELDIKESAQGGMGPHGLLIGATGSGKSELLRTLVLGLALTHSSETLNFILVDFKGGATFLGLDALPHTSALITNLADEAALVARMQDALHGELVRRQELLRRAGNFTSLLAYEQARAAGIALDPLPTLFVIVDEFSELLAAQRDFIELFIMIGRLGRSLGVHLLLASQRLEDGRINQLESHLSYRIGLRTFSAMESRSVIGVADAYELPSAPGNGYLRSDVSTLTRFKAAYVSGAYRPARARIRQEIIQRQVVAYGTDVITTDQPPADPAAGSAIDAGAIDAGSPDAATRSVLEVVARQLAGQGPPAHRVWLPPLAESPTVDMLLPPLVPDPEHGLRPAEAGSPLTVPVGFVDKPFEQTRELLMADLSGVGGHVGIAGGPQSGKSTLLRTLICALALTHSPAEAQFYCLDFGGGTLNTLAHLPHVGGVAGRLDAERVSRMAAEVTAILVDRERRFAEQGVHHLAHYRQLRAAGAVHDPYGDVFIVVDGWYTLRQDFAKVEELVRRIAAQGLNYGLHLILTAARWSEVHHTMRDQIGTRLELRLGDPVDSVIDLRAAATVPALPGRGLTSDKQHFLAALPRIDGVAGVADLADGTQALAEAVAECWSGPAAPAVRMLPTQLDVADLPAPEGDLRVALGLDEERLEPVWHHFGELPHLTVLGDAGSGKTNLLRLLARAVVERFTPGEARLLLVDYRRVLFDIVPEAYRLGHAVSADATRDAVADAVAGMKLRLPGPDVTPEQLRARDWWTGPRLFVLVDDFDLLAGQDNPLAPLMPMLPQGGDIGLHVVVARGAAGSGRISLDPLIRRLGETNTPDVVLSCPPSEGTMLGGVKPRHLPPGRALLCTRRGGRLLQTGYLDPGATAHPGRYSAAVAPGRPVT